ncbi:unannotated protein [freshwater metagenome]|uniref:Unannotated protein n=1 Tax=freshwater metagenome TaxID=449393 RepID=A0A6J7UNF5_9ZZZZ
MLSKISISLAEIPPSGPITIAIFLYSPPEISASTLVIVALADS